MGTTEAGRASSFSVVPCSLAASTSPGRTSPHAALTRAQATPHGHSPLTVLFGSFQKRSDGPQVALVSQEQCLDFPL